MIAARRGRRGAIRSGPQADRWELRGNSLAALAPSIPHGLRAEATPARVAQEHRADRVHGLDLVQDPDLERQGQEASAAHHGLGPVERLPQARLRVRNARLRVAAAVVRNIPRPRKAR